MRTQLASLVKNISARWALSLHARIRVFFFRAKHFVRVKTIFFASYNFRICLTKTYSADAGVNVGPTPSPPNPYGGNSEGDLTTASSYLPVMASQANRELRVSER